MGWNTFKIIKKNSILNDAADDLGWDLNTTTSTARSLIYSPLANLTETSPQNDNSKKLIDRYNSLRSFYNCANFYELTQEAIKLLTIGKIREKYLKRWKFVLVDEYQDLNRADQEMIRLLTDRGKWLTLAGDDNQSIYGSMRFAYPKGMREINSLYLNIQLRKLEVSMRCSQKIMKSAMAIANLQKDGGASLNKNLFSIKGEGQHILIAPLSMSKPKTDRYDEADWICERVVQILDEYREEKPKILILGQNKKFLNNIFKRMQEKNILGCELQKPDPLDKANQENLNLFWHLRLTLNKNDNLAFRRILGKERARNLSKIREKAEKKGTFWDLSDEPDVTRVKKTIDRIKKIISMSTSLEIAIKRVSKLIGHSDKEQLNTFLGNFKGSKGLTELIDVLSLELTEQAPAEKKDDSKIKLMTFHSCKGLGEHTVFLAGLEEGFLPRKNNQYSDEEVRLFYVALTRAKSNLFLSFVWRRYDGTSYDKGGARKPSCFVDKIPQDCRAMFRTG